MKKLMSLLLAVLMLATVIPFAAVSVSAQTTEADLVITTADELRDFATAVNAGDNFSGKVVALGADIDLANEEWTPIGSATANPFCGTFDGRNYTISNLSVTDGRNFAGLFGRVGLKEGQGPAGKVMNVTVNNANIKGYWYTAVIAGAAMYGDLINCDVTGTVNVEGYCDVAAVAGIHIGNVADCDVTGNVNITGYCYIGGIVGNGYSNIDNCTVIANDGSAIESTASYCGGIIGYTGEGSFLISDCEVKNISVSGVDTTGGIAGMAHYGVVIADSSVTDIDVAISGGDGTGAAIAGSVNGNATQPNGFYNNTVTGATLNGTETVLHVSGLTSGAAATDKYFVGDNVVLDDSGKIVSGNFSVYNESIADKVLAEGTTVTENADGTFGVVSNYVATVDGEKYTSLQAAIDAAADGKTVTLLANVELTETVTVNGNVTLDLAGKAITVTKSGDRSLYAFDNQGTFTLTDSVGNGSVTARGIKNYGTMIMNDGTVVACDTNGGYGIWNYGSFTMNDGTLKATHVGSYADDYGPCCLGVEAGSTATVNGGTIESVSARTYAIISNGTLNITDVTMTAPRVVSVNSGVATISGGTFTATDSRIVDGNYTAYETYYALYVVGGAKVTVTGGTFDAYEQALYSVGDTNIINISDGTFKKPLTTDGHASAGVTVSGGVFYDALPEEFCAEGFVPTENEDGSFGVVVKPADDEVIAEGNWNEDGSITWTLTGNGTLTVSGTGEMAGLKIGNSPVADYADRITAVVISDGITKVGARAFRGMTALVNVVIGNDVTEIAYEAFMDCSALVNVSLNEGIVKLDSLAFSGTAIETIELPSSLENLNNRVFKNCANLKTIALPDSVTYTGYELFMGCTSLESFKWSENCGWINSVTFSGCTSLTEVVIPSNIIHIKANAFQNCTGLVIITFEDSDTLVHTSTDLPALASNAFEGCANVIVKAWSDSVVENVAKASGLTFEALNTTKLSYTVNADGTATVTGVRGNSAGLNIPESVDGYTVTAIGAAAFRGHTNIVSVTLPATLKTIGARAFEGCTSIGYIHIPAAVEKIDYNAFTGCTGMTSVTFDGTSVETIGAFAFKDCSALATVKNLDKQNVVINKSAFANTALTSVALSDGTTVKGNPFTGVIGLTITCSEGSAAHTFAVSKGFSVNLI